MYSKHIALLERLSTEGKIQMYNPDESNDADIAQELYKSDLVTCSNPKQIRGGNRDIFVNFSITVKGREQLLIWKKEIEEKSISGVAKKGFKMSAKAVIFIVSIVISVVITHYVTKALVLKDSGHQNQSETPKLHDKE